MTSMNNCNECTCIEITKCHMGPLIGKVLKKGVGSYTNYRNDKDLFVTFLQKWGWALMWAWALERISSEMDVVTSNTYS